MGIRAGAKMTNLGVRFVALRCKDTIAPTGTLAQGVGARQVNSLGEIYEGKYGIKTHERVQGTVQENLEGRGPCYLKTVGITPEQDEDLQRAYLNMAPSQTLRWIESGQTPSVQNVEIEGTEPYITGGHTASGYLVDVSRETTVKGLFAAGDVAGGCPQKYVTGAFVEGEIAAKSAIKYLSGKRVKCDLSAARKIKNKLESILNSADSPYSTDALEEEMQSGMDEYAGGITKHYKYTEKSLEIAAQKINAVELKLSQLSANDMQELCYILELSERLTLCGEVIKNL
jgi:adenylylsulfate reductase subunit A